MAAFKRFLAQTRRCHTTNTPPTQHLSYLFRRTFSSEVDNPPIPVDNPPIPEANLNARRPLPVQPVSYPAKPKPEPVQQIQPESQQWGSKPVQQPSQDQRSWTRDEMRYMKDSAAPIAPVSYPNRTAPLPEDRARVEEEGMDRNEEFRRERRRIDDERMNVMRERRGLRYGTVVEEDLNLPFPKPIKVEGADQNSMKKKIKVVYDLKEAIRLVKASARVTFDETLEAHVKMTPDLKRTDLKLNGFVRFPHGFGKKYSVAAFAEGAAADEARDAGADLVGGPELVEQILGGQVKITFDKCVATPAMMQHVKKLSRTLKQLMPDPKKKTVTNDMSRAVKESKEQGVLFKKDKTAIVHVGVGKLSFSEEALRENVGAFVNALLLAKPAGLKKSSKYAGYVDSFHICSTMGASFPITIQSLTMASDRYTRLQLGVQSESA